MPITNVEDDPNEPLRGVRSHTEHDWALEAAIQRRQFELSAQRFQADKAARDWAAQLRQGGSGGFHQIAVTASSGCLDELLGASVRVHNIQATVAALAAAHHRAAETFGAGGASGASFSVVQALDRWCEPSDFTNAVLEVLQAHDHCGTFVDLHASRLSRNGVGWAFVRYQASKRWSSFAAAVVMTAMWRSFVEYQLRPESGYVRRRVLRRLARAGLEQRAIVCESRTAGVNK